MINIYIHIYIYIIPCVVRLLYSIHSIHWVGAEMGSSLFKMHRFSPFFFFLLYNSFINLGTGCVPVFHFEKGTKLFPQVPYVKKGLKHFSQSHLPPSGIAMLLNYGTLSMHQLRIQGYVSVCCYIPCSL